MKTNLKRTRENHLQRENTDQSNPRSIALSLDIIDKKRGSRFL